MENSVPPSADNSPPCMDYHPPIFTKNISSKSIFTSLGAWISSIVKW